AVKRGGAEVRDRPGASHRTPLTRSLVVVRQEVQRGKVRRVENRVRGGKRLVQGSRRNAVTLEVAFGQVCNSRNLSLRDTGYDLEAAIKGEVILVFACHY